MELFNAKETFESKIKNENKEIEDEPTFTDNELRLFEKTLNDKDIEVDIALLLDRYKTDIILLIRRNLKNGLDEEKIIELAGKYVDTILQRIENKQ